MTTRFYNAKILCLNEDFAVTDGELWTDGDKISFIGIPKEPHGTSFDQEINVSGNLLMPGLKNAHTHSAMTFARSYADDLPLWEWLSTKIFPLEDKLNPDYIYTFTKIALLEYISSGTTAVFDMYFKPEVSAQAAKEYGFRYAICGAQSAEVVEKYYDELNRFDPLISFQLGFHAEYTTPLDSLKETAALAKSKKAPVFTHNSETKNEVDGCIERYGKTPTELFEELGIYDHGGGGFHCVYLSENDIDILLKRGVYAVANPCSNLKLASGISQMSTLSERGINLAIGTDGPSSNNALSLWREIYLFSTLQKYLTGNAAAMPAANALITATKGSARAMRLPQCDCLAVGKQADLIVIDLNKPNMQPVNNIVANLVYSGSDSNVKLTMIAGRILFRDGEFFVGEDPQALYEKANKLMRELCSS